MPGADPQQTIWVFPKQSGPSERISGDPGHQGTSFGGGEQRQTDGVGEPYPERTAAPTQRLGTVPGELGVSRLSLRTGQGQHQKADLPVLCLSLVIYLVFPKRSLGGDFNIVKFVEML